VHRIENVKEKKFRFARFGMPRMVGSARLRLLCAVGHVATFAVNAALVAGQ